MALTGEELLAGFGRFLGDDWTGTTTIVGASDGTTLIDTTLRRFGDDGLNDWYLRPTSGTYTRVVRRVSDFASATGTCVVAPAWAGQIASGVSYGLHLHDPRHKFSALDAAIIALTGRLPKVVYDETITLDGVNKEFALPAAIRKGPILVQVEDPVDPEPDWNLLSNPRGDSLTNWTASAGTSELYAQSTWDLLVPKYDTNCTHWSVPLNTASTYRQVVAAMTDIVAADAAGRRMTFAMWVYARVASRVRIEIVDDNGQVGVSNYHQGKGWELLTVTADVSAGNATTLTVGLTVTSGAAMELFWNRAWFFFGDQMPSYYPDTQQFYVRRDGSTATLLLPTRLQGKRNIRLIGAGPLTTLGTDTTTQSTTSVEVDAYTAEVLYAKAAQILLGNETLSTPQFADVAQRIRVAEVRLEELGRQWMHDYGTAPRVKGPYG